MFELFILLFDAGFSLLSFSFSFDFDFYFAVSIFFLFLLIKLSRNILSQKGIFLKFQAMTETNKFSAGLREISAPRQPCFGSWPYFRHHGFRWTSVLHFVLFLFPCIIDVLVCTLVSCSNKLIFHVFTFPCNNVYFYVSTVFSLFYLVPWDDHRLLWSVDLGQQSISFFIT